MRRIRLTVSYDGTAYRGFQLQPNGPTIQSAMEEALGRLLGEEVRLRPAGRTDAGVHARAQVVDFADSGRRDPATIVRGGNALLPPDIRIATAEEAPPEFDARRSARSKEYRYFLYLSPVSSPFFDRFAWHVEAPLGRDAMRAALAHLVGEHDFTSFRGQGCTAKSPVREVTAAALEAAGGVPGLFAVVVKGNAFLRHMVRNIVGTAVDAGRGKIAPDAVSGILAARDRTRAGPTAPARGLFLWEVLY